MIATKPALKAPLPSSKAERVRARFCISTSVRQPVRLMFCGPPSREFVMPKKAKKLRHSTSTSPPPTSKKPSTSPLRGTPRPPTTLFLDLGKRTGWALKKADGSIESGVFQVYTDKEASSLDDGVRYLRLLRFVDGIDKREKLEQIGFEKVSGGTKGRQTELYNGYKGMVQVWAAHHDLVSVAVPVSTIKKSICGSGKGCKSAVIDAVRARGFSPYDDNDADALGGLLFLTDRHAVDFPITNGDKPCSPPQKKPAKEKAATARVASAKRILPTAATGSAPIDLAASATNGSTNTASPPKSTKRVSRSKKATAPSATAH